MSEINRYGISGGAAVQVASGYFPEGQAPSTLNDASRSVMADVRRYIEQTTPETTATYSAGAYTLALTRDLSAGELTQGFTAAFIAGSTNSASATLNINSTGAKNLLDNAGTHIVGEALQNHDPVNVVYDKKKDGYRVTDQLKAIAELSPAKLSGVDELTASAVHATNVVTTQLNGYQIGGRRNMVYNGDMAVAQRGATVACGAGANAYGPDRWQGSGNCAGAFNMIQQAETPDGFANSLQIDVSTADASLAVGDYVILQQKFEGFDVQRLNKGDAQARPVTLSFWARSSKTGVHIAELQDRDNLRWCSQSYTIAVADTWEYQTLTYPADTTGALDDDNAASLDITFWFLAGSTYSGGGSLGTTWHTTANTRAVGQVNVFDSTSNNLYLTGLQLELGDTATAFEYEGYGENLARCQRYYNKMIVGDTGYFYAPAIHSGTYRRSNFNFPVPMRSETITTAQSGITGHTGTPAAIAYREGVQWQMNVSAAGNLSYFTTNGYITNDAEI